MNPLRTPSEWERILDIKIMDPDGWDRKNFSESWSKEITRDEFKLRAMSSSTMAHSQYLTEWGSK